VRWIIYSDTPLGEWDWTASGGSEQFHIELAERLAARGHEVYSYAPVPWKFIHQKTHKGVKWNHIEKVDPTLEGVWIIQRNPDIIYAFPEKHPNQTIWMSVHDFDYHILREKSEYSWAEKFDGILCESLSHAKFLQDKYPDSTVLVTGAGIPPERISKVPPLARNPKRLMWSSSATRGLPCLLRIFKRAREEVRDLELYVCYGWESIDAAIDRGFESEKLRRFKERTTKLLEQPGVTSLGRLPSTYDVWCEYMKSGIWCYPTEFHETANNTVMEAQMFGAIPIVNPTWATGDHTLHGVRIYGDPWEDRKVQAEFVRAIVHMATNPELQEQIRVPMMKEAREVFTFDKTVDRIERLAPQGLQVAKEMAV
jgi:glycosyltransferase involved in cell wall biosynthesis